MDLTGKRFGRLTVIRQDGYHYYPGSKRKTQWLCKCDCGNTVTVIGSDLNNGHTQSCGCFRKESATSQSSTHGMSGTRLYRIWCAMKTRCTDKNAVTYCNYGGRGIKICKEWSESFDSFQKWALTNGYSSSKSIDRIDVNGDYQPSNCRWATIDEQSVNRRTTRYITCFGKTKSVKEWADEMGLIYSCLQYRLDAGWDVERALTTPSKAYAGRRTTRTD